MQSAIVIALATLALGASAAAVLAFAAARRAAVECSESGRAYQSLVDASPLGLHFYRVDAAGDLVFDGANPAADRLLGIRNADKVGQRILEAFPMLADTPVPAAYLEAALHGTSWSTEQIAYEDGVIAGAFEVVAFQTSPRHMVAVFSDITERKRLEFGRDAERAFSEAIIESMPGIFYMYSLPGLRLVRWNRNHETALGYGPGELAGKSILDFHLPEAREAVLEAVDRAERLGSEFMEAPLVAKDGSVVPYLLTGAPFESGGSSYLVGVGLDIRERKAAEEALRRLNAELEARVAGRTAELRQANASLEGALLELRASRDKAVLSEKMAALGHLVAGLAHELNTPLGAIRSSAETASSLRSELSETFRGYREATPEGAALLDAILSRPAQATTAPDGASIRETRRTIQSVLERSGHPEAGLVADLLAEAGYPYEGAWAERIARIPGLPGLAKSAYRISALDTALSVTRTAADKAAVVVHALSAYASGSRAGEPVPVDVVERLELALTLHGNLIKRSVEVVRSYAPVPKASAHPESLDLAFMNLIRNALQAMRFQGRLELATAFEDGMVAVSVIDDGPGIPPEVAPHIFEPFFTTKPEGEGTGLGLDASRKALERIGGTIDFESRPGRTRFTARLCPESVRAVGPGACGPESG